MKYYEVEGPSKPEQYNITGVHLGEESPRVARLTVIRQTI
jgi:hypothetical protein